MKKLIFRISVAATLCVAASVTQAQTTLEGKLMRMSDFATTDMHNMSQYNAGFGTARSSAMGGAFTSLGADLSSMNINPAGLGMYRGSEFGVTMSVMSSNTDSKVNGGFSKMNDKTKFALNNIGIAFNVYQGTGALTSFTLGFGYNKLADFNYNTGVRLADDNSSINQIFMNQLRGYDPAILGSNQDPFDNYNVDVLDWGAVLAYQAGVLVPMTGAGNKYELPGWTPATTTTHFLNTVNKGSIGEYSLSGGMNFNNFFYLGFAVGIQDIYYEENAYYDEQYPGNAEDMNYMLYDQRVKFVGSGVNFKLGAILRPTEGLRIGVTVHTPTFVSLDRKYAASMSADYRAMGSGSAETVDRMTTNLLYDYKYNSPTRLMVGASYTMQNVGILSVDYERTWYNGMRLADVGAELRDEWKTAVKDQYQAANNFRAGLEIKPIEALALRAGYAYYGSVVKDDNRVFYQPISTKGYNISAGIGYRYKNFNLDFAYIYMNSTLSAYDLYYYNGADNDGNNITVTNPSYIETTRTRNNFTLSMGLRF